MKAVDLWPGPELDALVAEKVMGWTRITATGAPANWIGEHGQSIFASSWRPSTDPTCAWKLMQKVARLAGAWRFGDGFFVLRFAEAACHNDGEGCKPVDCVTDEEEAAIDERGEADPQPWSCHIHLGGIGAQPEGTYPASWDHGSRFCARGRTAEHAICLATLIAYGAVDP